MPESTIIVPTASVRELAKLARAASYHDGQAGLEALLRLPGVGAFVADIAARNDAREHAAYPGDFAAR